MSEQTTKTHMELQNEAVQVLRTVYDPEIPVDIYELGLIYEVKADPASNIHILMTLTSPACPVAESLPEEVKTKVKAIEGVKEVEVDLTFDPPWDMSMMSEAAKLELGFL